MNRLEVSVLGIGFTLLCVAVAAVDWRIGLAVFGLGLMASVIDQPRVRP